MTAQPSLLDNLEKISQFDTQNMLGSIEALHKQIAHAWESTLGITITPKAPIQTIVVAGMGGSGLGADVIKFLFKETLPVPLDIVHDYTLPKYVDETALVVLSSYSGTTEEVLACAEQAQQSGATIVAITAGGDLANLAQQHGWPCYVIDPQFNPCNQPRQAIGYSVVGMMGLFERAGMLQVSTDELEIAIERVRQVAAECNPSVPTENNPAKLLAFQLIDKQAVLIAPDFLQGAVHVTANQSNENAKSFTSYYVVPELNHHLLEALRYPKNMTHTQVHFFFHSDLAHAENQVRMKLTESIFAEHQLDTVSIELEGTSQLAQGFELIALMSFASVYQAVLQGIDPSPIPNVESFKKQLHDSRQ